MDNGFDEMDQFDNLWINCWEDDTLDQYVNDMDKNLNESFQYEKEQCSQKLFQSFQNSACAVAQMFKDKSQHITPWNSFQNAAGAITILYKDSLDASKAHFDLGVNIGQQRKTKELINWLRKKKRRHVRKDELISFLLGKPAPNQRLLVNRGLVTNRQLRNTNTNPNGNNNGNNANTDTHSDLATFREALIMHNRTHDLPINSHSHQHHQQQNALLHAQSQQTSANHNCDDLDCFFCEQIATHIEHKRSASSADIESPTRKRTRFH